MELGEARFGPASQLYKLSRDRTQEKSRASPPDRHLQVGSGSSLRNRPVRGLNPRTDDYRKREHGGSWTRVPATRVWSGAGPMRAPALNTRKMGSFASSTVPTSR